MKKKIIVTIMVILAIIGGMTAFFVLKNKNKEIEGLVYVESIENIMDVSYVVNSRYVGVVASQDSKNVNPDSGKKVKKLNVSVGDMVKEGDVLFEYDTDEMDLKVKQLQLELQSINNNIATLNQDISDLAKQRDAAPAENKIEYTTQIQYNQAEVNQLNYDASSKQLEIDRQKAAMENNTVLAPMDGIINEINESVAVNNANSDIYGSGYMNYDSKPYISIMALGDYRVKGTVSEFNVRNLSKGEAVIVHSIMDETLCWKGIISSIDKEHTESNNTNNFTFEIAGVDSPETASNYAFFINLESTDGLMLGEHIFIEPDSGQGNIKEGLWLSEFYIIQDDSDSYVWVENKKGKIEKRKVTLGDYDENMKEYKITSGLSNMDYIAYPEERIKEGMKTTRNQEEVKIYEDEAPEDAESGGEEAN